MNRAVWIILLMLAPGLVSAQNYDVFTSASADVFSSDTVTRAYEDALLSPATLFGTTCLIPREGQDRVDALSGLIAQYPGEARLYWERARARAALPRFDEAEQDYIDYTNKSTDRAAALHRLADYYGGRLAIDRQLEILQKIFDLQAAAPQRTRAQVSATLDEIFQVGREQNQPVDRSAYRKKLLDLFPDDPEAALEYLNQRLQDGDLKGLNNEILKLAERFPDRPEPFWSLLATLFYQQGDPAKARAVFFSRLSPESPPETFEAFLALLREWGQYDELRAELAPREEALSDRDLAILFHIYREEAREDLARALLDRWSAQKTEPSVSWLWLESDYNRRARRPERAVKLLYTGLQLAPEPDRPQWLVALGLALIESRAPALELPGSLAGVVRDRRLDPDPGLSGGLLSLLLNQDRLGEVAADLDQMEGRRRNLAQAQAVRERLRLTYPNEPGRADLDYRMIQANRDLGYWHEVAAAAGTFKIELPGDARVREVARERAVALSRLGRRDEARAEWDALLAAAPDDPAYLEILDEYGGALEADGRPDEMLALYWRELQARPHFSQVYDRALQAVARLNLGDEESKIYRAAAASLGAADWRSRLSLWYLKRQMKAEYQTSLDQAVAQLPEDEIQSFLELAVPEWPFNAQTIALKASLYLSAHHRHPTNPQYMAAYLRLAAQVPAQPCPDADCPDPVRDFARRVLLFDHQIGQAASQALLDRLMSQGNLPAAVDELKGKPGLNPAEEYFLARADDRLGRWEDGVVYWRRLADQYPATPFFAEALADRLRGLAASRPPAYPRARAEAQDRIERMAALYPADPSYPTRLGEWRADDGDLAGAIQSWEKLVAQAPGDESRYLDAAQACWDYYQYDSAVALIERARKMRGDQTLFRLELAAIREDMGNTEAAVHEYVLALSEDRSDRRQVLDRLAELARDPAARKMIERSFHDLAGKDPKDPAPIRAEALYLKETGRDDDAARVLADASPSINDLDFLRFALDQLHDHRHPSAEEQILKRIVQVKPADPAGRLDLIRFYRVHDRRPELNAAVSDAGSAVSGLPDPAQRSYWMLMLAAELTDAGDAGPAITVLQGALAQADDDQKNRISLELARRLIEAGRDDQAALALRARLETGWDEELFNELAQIYARGDNPAALVELNRRLQKVIADSALGRSGKKEAWSALHSGTARALDQCGEPASADQYYREWVNRDPADQARLREAWAHARRHNAGPQMIEYYRAEAERAAKDYRWSWVVARLAVWSGDLDLAKTAYNAAIANEPGVRELYRERAPLLIRRGELGPAAKTYQRLAELDPAEPDWKVRAVELHFRAGDSAEAMNIIERETEGATDYRRWFAAAAALERTPRLDQARPRFQRGLELLVEQADRLVIDDRLLEDLVRIFAESGRVGEALTLLDQTRRGLAVREADPANKYAAGRLSQNRAAVERAIAYPLAAAVRERGNADDRKAVRAWLADPVRRREVPAAVRYWTADNAGLPDEAWEALTGVGEDAAADLPSLETFARRRLRWDRLAEPGRAGPEARADALLWLGRDEDALTALASLYDRDGIFDQYNEELLDLAARLDQPARLAAWLDDGRRVEDEAGYFIRRGRTDLAERTLASHPRPAWSLAKRLLVRLYVKDFDGSLVPECSDMLRTWDVGRRLGSPGDETHELRGRDQAVMTMKYAEYLDQSDGPEAARPWWDAAVEDQVSGPAYRYEAQVLLRLGKFDEAQDRFERAALLMPGDPPSSYGQALARLGRGDRDGALPILTALAGDTVGPEDWDSKKSYQVFALLHNGFADEAVDIMARWAAPAAALSRELTAEAVTEFETARRLIQPGPNPKVTEMVRGLVVLDPDDTFFAERALDDNWLADRRDLGPVYDFIVSALQRGADDETRRSAGEDNRLDYWLSLGRAEEVVTALDQRGAGRAPSRIGVADGERRLRALVQLGRDAEARSFADAWLGPEGGDPDRLAAAYQVYCRLGKAEDAAPLENRWWERVLEGPDPDVSAYTGWARSLAARGQSDDAAAILTRMTEARPEDPAALTAAAETAEELGLVEAALAWRQQAGRADPFDAADRIGEAADLYRLGRMAESADAMIEMIGSHRFTRSDRLRLVRSLAAWLQDDSGPAAARELLPVVAKAADGDGPGREILAAAAAALAARAGDNGEADRWFKLALRLAPGEAAALAGEYYLDQDRPGEAAEVMASGIYYNPDEARLRVMYARALLRDGRPDAAVAVALTDGSLASARHVDAYGDVSARAPDLLAAGLTPDQLGPLVKELAAEMVRTGAPEQAADLLAAVADLLDTGADPADGPGGCQLPPVSGPAAADPDWAALRSELADEADRLRAAERNRPPQLIILPRLDNGIEWTWLMPELERPGADLRSEP